jgi:AcrR family transcriptional regulator
VTAARPRQRLTAEARREQLAAAAVEVVARDGYAAATAEAVARAAGVSKGLLWHYFADLDDLLAHAARRALAGLEAAVAADVDPAAPVPVLLRAAVHRAARLPATHGRELRAIRQITGNLRGPDGAPRLREVEYDGLHARQAELVRRGQREGHLRPDLDPLLVAVSYQGLVDTMLEHLDNHPGLDPAAFADHTAALLLGGITA